jgi:ABC-2 type transport system permease protein
MTADAAPPTKDRRMRINTGFVRLVALVARRDYLRTVRRRGFVAGTLLLPLAMGGLFAISALSSTSFGGGPSGPVLVVNESAVQIVPDPALTPHVSVVDRAQAEQQLGAHVVSEYFVVPATWPAQATVQVVAAEHAAGQPQVAITRRIAEQGEMDVLLRTSLIRNAGVPASVVAQLVAPVNYQLVGAAGGQSSDTALIGAYLVPYAFTLIFMLSIFITSGYLLQSVTEEKENRVVEIILSSVPALPLMAGKVLGLGAAGLTQVAIWVTTALVALPLLSNQFALTIQISPLTLVLAVVFFALGYLSYGAIYAAVGALAPGAREAQQYASVFGVVAVLPIVMLPAILTDPGGPLVVALCVLPLTAPAAMLAVLASSASVPWLLVVVSLVAQAVFVAVAVVATSRIFRATLLLYGVRPSLRRIASAMLARS